MANVKLYVTTHCPFCVRAKQFLTKKGVEFEIIDLTSKPDDLQELKSKTHWQTVPQIFIGEDFIGGYTDMIKLEDQGVLDKMLEKLKR